MLGGEGSAMHLACFLLFAHTGTPDNCLSLFQSRPLEFCFNAIVLLLRVLACPMLVSWSCVVGVKRTAVMRIQTVHTGIHAGIHTVVKHVNTIQSVKHIQLLCIGLLYRVLPVSMVRKNFQQFESPFVSRLVTFVWRVITQD